MNIGFIKDTLAKQAAFVKTLTANKFGEGISLWFNWLYCYIRYGATPSDWYCYELYKYRHRELRRFITRLRILNSTEYSIRANTRMISTIK